jgi:hypothetical protein
MFHIEIDIQIKNKPLFITTIRFKDVFLCYCSLSYDYIFGIIVMQNQFYFYMKYIYNKENNCSFNTLPCEKLNLMVRF